MENRETAARRKRALAIKRNTKEERKNMASLLLDREAAFTE